MVELPLSFCQDVVYQAEDKMTHFADCFWDVEFNSTNGYDILVRRMKDGRETCKEYEDFLKQRAKAEETFGKTLMKISKSCSGKDEIGHLKTSWEKVISQTENCGTSHINVASRLTEEAKKVEEFRELQKERRRKPEEAIKKMTQAKRDQYHKVMHSKRNYESRCKEADLAQDTYMKGRLVQPQKEQDKMILKRDKTRQSFNAADTQYQKEVNTLEQARQSWEEQMVQVCVIFQELETERICFLRNAMWVFANIISLQCCSDDENSDSMRNVLSECNEHNDIQLFIAQKSTGSTRPAPITYECYYKDNQKASPSGIANGRRRQTLPPVPREGTPRALPPKPSPPEDSSMYSSMAEYSTGILGQDMDKKYIASFDYEAQGEEELNIKIGDILTIISKEDSIWWYAEVNNKKGHVPAEYLAPYTDVGNESSNL